MRILSLRIGSRICTQTRDVPSQKIPRRSRAKTTTLTRGRITNMQKSNNKRATTVRQKREIYARRMLMHSAGTHATERKDRQVGGPDRDILSFARAFFAPLHSALLPSVSMVLFLLGSFIGVHHPSSRSHI